MLKMVKVIRNGKFWEIWNHTETKRLKVVSANKILDTVNDNDWMIIGHGIKLDVRVAAIRSDLRVGKASDSVIRFLRDDYLITSLNSNGIYTPTEAIKWALNRQRQWEERY